MLNYSLRASLMLIMSILEIERGEGCARGMGQETRRPGFEASQQLHASYTDSRTSQEGPQLRTWSDQEVKGGPRGCLPLHLPRTGQGEGRAVTMPSWSLPSNWPELQQLGSLRFKEEGGASVLRHHASPTPRPM